MYSKSAELVLSLNKDFLSQYTLLSSVLVHYEHNK